MREHAVAIGVGIVTACLALVLTPYSLWWWVSLLLGVTIIVIAGGHLLFERLRPKTIPKLICSFDMKNIGGCMCPNTEIRRPTTVTPDRIIALPHADASSAPTFSTLFGPHQSFGTVSLTGGAYVEAVSPHNRGTYYRVKVSAQNGAVFSCKGRLVALKYGSEKLIPEPIDLPFAPAKNSDRSNKTIHVGHAEHLDFLFIADDNHVEVTPPDFLGPSNVKWSSLFSKTGDYTFDIAVLSPAAQSVITILFHWTGKRETSRLVAMH